MAWLTSLLKKPEAPEPVVEEALEEAPPPLPTGPSLAILVPDNAGISSFRIAFSPDSHIAADYIGSLKADIRHETHAFWALHDKPIVEEGYHVEALVLIRAQPDSDLVYIVSFLDIESAFSFTRFEVRRGLPLGNVMIYWAAFAQLREELDCISISPPFAPPTENYVLPVHTYEQVEQPRVVAQQAIAEPLYAEPEPQPELNPEAPEERQQAQKAIDDYLHRAEKPKRRIIEPTPEPVAFEAPAVVNETPVAGVEPSLAIPEPVAEIELAPIADDDLGPMWPEATPQVNAAAPIVEQTSIVKEPEISSPVAEEQASIEEAFVFQHKTIEAPPEHHILTRKEKVGVDNGMLVDDEPPPIATFATDDAVVERLAARLRMANAVPSLADPEPGVETIPGDEELEFVPLNSGDPASGLTAAPKLDDFDIAYEVERLLRGRKSEQRHGPFSGFQSPPGRF